MARKDSTLAHLHDDADENERRRDALFEKIQKDGVLKAVEFCKDQWGIVTNKSSISRFNVSERARRADAEMFDKLAARANRAKAIAGKVRDHAPVVSTDTMKALDQAIYELIAINPDDARLDRLVDMLAKMMSAADKNAAVSLDVKKFQFDAVKAVLAHAELVREVTTSGLSEDEQVQKLGQQIFGAEWQ